MEYSQLDTLTAEISKEAEKPSPFSCVVRTPLRLVITWMKCVNQELREIRMYLNETGEQKHGS